MSARVELYAPEAFWQLAPADKAALCNGCGAKGFGGWLVPDTLWGLSIEPACDIHDAMYHWGRTRQDKAAADRVFLNNMLRLVEAHSGRLLKWLRRYRAVSYYAAVRDFGGPAFWAGKNPPAQMGRPER